MPSKNKLTSELIELCLLGIVSEVDTFYHEHKSQLNIKKESDYIFRLARLNDNLALMQWIYLTSSPCDLAGGGCQYKRYSICTNVRRWE